MSNPWKFSKIDTPRPTVSDFDPLTQVAGRPEPLNPPTVSDFDPITQQASNEQPLSPTQWFSAELTTNED